MSISQSARRSSAASSRRSSKAASISTLSSSDSDNQSHVTVDSETFSALYNHANALEGPLASDLLDDSESARLSVDSAGTVRAKRTAYMAYPQRLSDGTLKRLTGKGYGSSTELRLRHHRVLAGQPPQLSKHHELQCFNDDRGCLFKDSTKRIEIGRKALANNLQLRPGSGDKYTIRSSLTGQRVGSGLYPAARCDDKVMEEHVHDVSSMVFGAEPGAIRMPLKNPQDFSKRSQARPAPGSLYYSFASPPGKMNHRVDYEKNAVPKTVSPAQGRAPSAFVQQKVRRVENKHPSRNQKPKGGSGDSVQYETLWTTP